MAEKRVYFSLDKELTLIVKPVHSIFYTHCYVLAQLFTTINTKILRLHITYLYKMCSVYTLTYFRIKINLISTCHFRLST